MSKFDNRAKLNTFLEKVSARYLKGETEYGDRSFDLSPPELVEEIQEEVLDICAWSFFLFERLERVDKALAKLEDYLEENVRERNGFSPDFPEQRDFDVALRNALEDSDNPIANRLGREIFVKPGVGNRVGGGEPQRDIQHRYYGFDDETPNGECDECRRLIYPGEARLVDDHLTFCSHNCMYDFHGLSREEE